MSSKMITSLAAGVVVLAALAMTPLAPAAPLAASHEARSNHATNRYVPLRRARHYRSANLALRLSASPETVSTGQQLTYTATVVNTARRTDRNAGFRDLIPGKATLVSTTPSQGSCGGSENIVCHLGSLGRGDSATITIVVTASEPGLITDYAWVSTSTPRHWEHRNAVSTNVQGVGPDVDLKLAESPGNVNLGQQVTYTATVSNSGNGPAGTVAFQDLLPGKATFVSANASQGTCSGNPTIVCSLGSLNAGASATVTILVTASAAGWMTDHGWVSSNPPGNWQHHRTVSVYVHDVSSNVNLNLAGTPGKLDVGGQVTYTATVSNSGKGAAGTVAFQDLLPAKATLVSATPSQGTCSGNPMILCSLGSLNAGASSTVTIIVTANQPGPMTDNGWVSSNPPGHWQHHRTVTVSVLDVNAKVDLDLAGSPGAVDPGQQVTYRATVSNSGNGPAGAVAFQDLLPGRVTLVSATPSQGTCSGNPTILCNLGSLNAGASATVTIVVTATQPGMLTDRGWVSSNPPGNWQHERAVNSEVRNVSPALALRLTGSPGSLNAGQQVTFTATVTNTGNGSDANAGFQDVLPGNTALVSVTASQGTCAGNPAVVCNLGGLDRGVSATITIVVAANQPGTIIDRAWVSTNPPSDWEHQHSVATEVHPAPTTTVPATTTTTTHA